MTSFIHCHKFTTIKCMLCHGTLIPKIEYDYNVFFVRMENVYMNLNIMLLLFI